MNLIHILMSCFLLDSVASERIQASTQLGSMDIDPRLFDRVAIIPDIHGDAQALIRSIFLIVRDTIGTRLSFDGFIDAFVPRLSDASRGSALLEGHRILIIQLGDVADRGPNTKAAYGLMRKLSRVLGCPVVSLLGNHELYAHAWGSAPEVTQEDIRNFGGRQAFQAAFADGGHIWKMITEDYGLVARVGDSLFLHAGIDFAWFHKDFPIFDPDGSVNIDKVNVLGRRLLMNRGLVSSALLHGASPVMTRNFNTLSESALCNKVLPAIRRMFKVNRIFVGHMPDETVRSRCNGGIYLTDFAMSSGMRSSKQGRAGYVLVSLTNGKFGTVSKNIVWADSIATNRQLSFVSVAPTSTTTTTTTPEVSERDIELSWIEPSPAPAVAHTMATPAPVEGCCLPLAKLFRNL